MRTFSLLLAALILVFGLGLDAGSARAQATQTWVSGAGDDGNPCTRTSPCLTFQGALSKTLAGGEINCLDSGPFGAVAIQHSLTIDCTGVVGGVQASGTNAVQIVAAPTDVVVIEGLDIEGINSAPNGVYIGPVASVTIRNCRIAGFAGTPGSPAPSGMGIIVGNANNVELLTVDSVIEHNGYAGIYLLLQNGADLQTTINGCRSITTSSASSPTEPWEPACFTARCATARSATTVRTASPQARRPQLTTL
jgi:hypothetical protein